MDMRISGSGNIPAGEYEKVRISGSGRLHGLVRCESFHTSGASKGDQLDCKNELVVSGSSHFDGSIKAGRVSVSGSFSCGDVSAAEKMECSGGMKIEGNIKSGQISVSGSMKSAGNVKCKQLSVSGGFSAAGDVEAETVKVSGYLSCGGLLNAEEITIKFNAGMKIGDIGGSQIAIYKDDSAKRVLRLPLISSLLKHTNYTVSVQNSIEGDSIALEYVTAERVSGRVVAIGAGCEIGLVQYSDELEVSPDAKVERTEKI